MNPSDFSTISFPSLGIEINPIRAIEIGPFSIQLYGVMIALGLMLAVIYACKRSRQFGLTADDLTDGVLFIVPFAIICARAYYCIFAWDEYAANPIEVLYIWNGGLAIYGGVFQNNEFIRDRFFERLALEHSEVNISFPRALPQFGAVAAAMKADGMLTDDVINKLCNYK